MSRDPYLRLEDILAHCYFRAEDAIVWDAAATHNAALIKAVERLLKSGS